MGNVQNSYDIRIPLYWLVHRDPLILANYSPIQVGSIILYLEQPTTWMSQEVSKRLGSVGYNPNTPHF